MRTCSLLAAVLLTFLAAADADAARRSLRVDFGTEWGSPRPCDQAALDDTRLRWRGYTFAGYEPLSVRTTFCQYSAALAASNLYSPEDAPIRNLLEPGETISAARYWFLDGASSFPGEGDRGFQWMFHYFDDAIIVGLNGPAELDDDFTWQPLATDSSSTYLTAADGTRLWDGNGFDDEYLCFRRDGTFLGAFSGTELASCRQGAATAALLPKLVPLMTDVNGNGSPDMAVLKGSGPFVAEVRDGGDGAFIQSLSFLNAEYDALAAIALRDTDSDPLGAPEIAVLGVRTSTGRGVLQVRNVGVGASTARRTILLPPGFSPVDVAGTGDPDEGGVYDVGILTLRERDQRAVILRMKLLGDPQTQSILLNPGADPMRILNLNDADSNGVQEYATLLRRRFDGRGLVQITNVDADRGPAPLVFLPRRTPVDLAIVEDADRNNIPEVAVLLVSNMAERNLVQLMNASGTPGDLRVRTVGGRSAIGLLGVGDANGTGNSDIAVLALLDVDGSGRIEILEGESSSLIRRFLIPSAHRTLSMAYFTDLDGNGSTELGVLTIRNGQPNVLLRNLVGDPLPRGYVFSP